MNYSDTLKCNHPLFTWASEGGWSDAPEDIREPAVFVFERGHWITPTRIQLARYRISQWIVEKLGGLMKTMEWELAGPSPVLTQEDVNFILAAVQRDNPELEIISHWNGAGCYTMSVGVARRSAPGTRCAETIYGGNV